MASSCKLGEVSVELSKESKQLKWEVRPFVITKLRGYWCDERRSVVSINRGRVGKSLYWFF